MIQCSYLVQVHYTVYSLYKLCFWHLTTVSVSSGFSFSHPDTKPRGRFVLEAALATVNHTLGTLNSILKYWLLMSPQAGLLLPKALFLIPQLTFKKRKQYMLILTYPVFIIRNICFYQNTGSCCLLNLYTWTPRLVGFMWMFPMNMTRDYFG